MPWKETCVMDERVAFIAACLAAEESMAELCRSRGISRKTGYKWLERYRDGGTEALVEHSRAPLTHPHAIGPEMARLLIEARMRHRNWGARKLLAWLAGRHARSDWPAPSTVSDLLKNSGLVNARRRRRHATPAGGPLIAAHGPNETWCADFKGCFFTGDAGRCDPLTISDAHSRFLLRCQAVAKTDGEHVRAIFEACFRQFGLPVSLRTDNGPPFASTGLGGLTRLSVSWLRLGIRLERIEAGHPEQNGRHERMHLTLKQDAACPPARTLRAQQRQFDRWREEYNNERPHEALGQRPPAEFYAPSPRPYPARLEEIEYPDDWTSRSVRKAGQMKWDGHDVRVSRALRGERVGLEPVGDGVWRVHFAHLVLGMFDERELRIRPLKRAWK